MTAPLEYRPLQTETSQVVRLDAQCFTSPLDSEAYLDRIGTDNFRIICQNGKVAGSLALLPMGQWWGGKRVPMMGIGSVGVFPEHRGSGVALTLMQKMLRELHEQGVSLSTLYPATQRLYRKVGYEQAGTYNAWSVRTQEIQLKDRSQPILPVEPIQLEAFSYLHQQFAQRANGNLDRSSPLWQGILKTSNSEPLYAYWIGSEPPEGYVIFKQHRANHELTLQVQDWVVLSAAAGRTLWAFLADHRSTIDKVSWHGGLLDPLTLLLPEQSPEIKSSDRWLMRLVDVRSALEKRGYPIGVEAELHLDVADDLLPENSGKFILMVSQGQGEVRQGGRGEMKLTIRGLAPLYSGLFSPKQLQWMGFLDAPEPAIHAATQMFAGTSPWLPDFF